LPWDKKEKRGTETRKQLVDEIHSFFKTPEDRMPWWIRERQLLRVRTPDLKKMILLLKLHYYELEGGAVSSFVTELTALNRLNRRDYTKKTKRYSEAS